MNSKKLIITLISLVLVVAAVALCFYFFVFKNNSLRIVELGRNENTTLKKENFSKSFMNLYSNGTFDIKIIYNSNDTEQIIFVGIGQYQKESSNYLLTFIDNTSPTAFNQTSCEFKGNRLHFQTPDGQIYYFG
ncbi:MAG: hypothetical protein LBH47_02415 [Christensenellaceae bacterium]|jgi:flagellar basal body-associated protein FliL|nr:hypothetical protein [Christensenellaceae bacterium]